MKTLAVLTISLLLAATATFAADSNKIIGNNDLIAVDAEATNIPLKYKNIVDAFGIISMGCTATHIGGGYVLTAGHCFGAGDALVRDRDCANVTVDWGVREGKPAYLKSNCERVLFAQRNNLSNDFAIFKVSPVPPVAVGIDLTRRALPGDSITIFSHPRMVPLRWSQLCTVETILDPGLPQQALHHQCDTDPGSSGATILNANTKRVVAIHDGGRLTGSDTGMNYGTDLTNAEVAAGLHELGFK